MPNWFYENKEVVEEYQFDEKAVGFVYMITNIETGKLYIGRKVFTNTLTKKLTKKEISEQSGPGRKPTKKKVSKESNWREYWGSCKPLLAEVKEIGEDKFKRSIDVPRNEGSIVNKGRAFIEYYTKEEALRVKYLFFYKFIYSFFS